MIGFKEAVDAIRDAELLANETGRQAVVYCTGRLFSACDISEAIRNKYQVLETISPRGWEREHD